MSVRFAVTVVVAPTFVYTSPNNHQLASRVAHRVDVSSLLSLSESVCLSPTGFSRRSTLSDVYPRLRTITNWLLASLIAGRCLFAPFSRSTLSRLSTSPQYRWSMSLRSFLSPASVTHVGISTSMSLRSFLSPASMTHAEVRRDCRRRSDVCLTSPNNLQLASLDAQRSPTSIHVSEQSPTGFSRRSSLVDVSSLLSLAR